MPTSLNDSVEWTTNAGTPVVDNDHSLTVGQRGPVLLEDYHLLEKLAQFDRERIPERVVHARGMSAKGYFEVCSHDMSADGSRPLPCSISSLQWVNRHVHGGLACQLVETCGAVQCLVDGHVLPQMFDDHGRR